MAADSNDNVEARYKKFAEFLYQYLTDPIKDFASVKPEILSIMKTYRPIKVVDFQYGISNSLKRRSQLIVHEFNKRASVREYFNSGKNTWSCCECNRTSSSQSDTVDLIIRHGMVFVKIEHDCKPRELSFVLKVQKLYKEKKMEEANALQKSVLGSEDLCSTKNVAAGKRGTKDDATAQIMKDIAAMKTSLDSQRNNESLNESDPPTMDEQIEERLPPDEMFAKIIENLKEYTTEKAEVVLSNKTRILTVLKTRRPIKIADYFYGMSRTLKSDNRLIVFEFNDRKRVREYTKHESVGKNFRNWYCVECVRLYWHKRIVAAPSYLNLYSGIFFAFIDHSPLCKAKDYELVMIYQKFLQEGDTTKANSMVKLVNFIYGEGSYTNVKNALNPPASSSTNSTLSKLNDNGRNSETLTNSKRKLGSNGNDSNKEDLPAHKKFKGKKNNNEVDDPLLHQDPKTSAAVEMEKESVSTTSSFHFEKPSISKLEQICDKLGIDYRNRAVKLWDKIKIEQTDTVSSPTNIEIHEYQTENFYEILSKFFTGKSNQHGQVRASIIEAFREKMVDSGQMKLKKFNKLYSITVTDEHFAFIAQYLRCRLLIFDGEEIRKFGKWNAKTSKRLTLPLYLSPEGYYSIVLNC